MNLLTQLSQLEGKTVKRAVFDDESIIAMAFEDGDIVIVKANTYIGTDFLEIELVGELHCLSDDTQLKLGIIDQDEHDRRRMEWGRRLTEQTERNERETLARLKAKYEG